MTQAADQTLDFSTIHRVLVTKLRFHGDVLLSSPVFQALKHHHPHLKVDALIYAETHDMLSLHPAIDTIYTIDKRWKALGIRQHLSKERQLLGQLAARHYDMIIHLTEDWRGFYLKYLLNIPIAVTAQYTRRNNNWFWQRCFTHIYPVPKARHKASSHLDALRYLGIDASADEEQPSLTISDIDQHHAQQLRDKLGLRSKDYILIHPTSRFFYKCWPPQTMADLVRRLINHGHKVVVTAAPNQKEALYMQQLLKNTPESVVNLSGQVTLKQLAAMIQHCRCFVGVDSAPMHIAVAVNAPVVALFGPTNADVWGPTRAHSIVLKSNTCFKPGIVNGERPNELENCTLDISEEAVFNAVVELTSA